MKELTREEINWMYDEAEKQAWKERNKYKIESEFSDLKDEAIRRISLKKIYEKEPDAPKVCALLQEGKLSYVEIANRFDLYEYDVLSIAQRKTYLDISRDYIWDEKKYIQYDEEVPDIVTKDTHRNYRPRTIKYDDDTIIMVCQLIQDGLDVKDIAYKCDVSESLVNEIRNKRSHTDISKNYIFPKRKRERLYLTSDLLCGRQYKHLITTDSSDSEQLKRLIIDGVKTDFVANNLGTIWNRTNWKVITTGKKFDIYGEEFNEKYELRIDGKHIIVNRDRIVASLFLPVPEQFKDLSTAQMRVYKRNPYIESFHYTNRKTGEELFDYSYLTEKNLKWGL